MMNKLNEIRQLKIYVIYNDTHLSFQGLLTLLLSKMTLKNDHPSHLYEPLSIPNLSYTYYLNQGYQRHKYNISLQDARNCYDAAIILRPYRSEAYYNRSLLLIHLKDQKLAKRDIMSAISSEYLRIALSEENAKSFNTKDLLEEALKYSNNNFLAKQFLSKISGFENSQRGKKYWVMWDEYDGLLRENNAIYPGNNFRLNGVCSKELQEQQLRMLLTKYSQLSKNNKDQILKATPSKQCQSPYIKINIKSTQKQLTQINLCSKVFDISIAGSQQKQQNVNYLNLPFQSSDSYHRVNSSNISTLSHNHYANFEVLNESSYSVNSFSLANRLSHTGCVKCQKKSHSQYIPSEDCSRFKAEVLRIEVKTVQIFRSCSITQPKPYIIFNQLNEHNEFKSDEQIISEVDYRGGFFPKWGNLSFFSEIESLCEQTSENKENDGEVGKKCKIELWHKEARGDVLIGKTTFRPKKGRYKCSLSTYISSQMKKRNTGYIYVEIKK